MSRARRLFKGIRELYEEYGVPLVNQIIDELGPEQAKKVRFPEKVRVEAQKRAAKPLAVRPRTSAPRPEVKALPKSPPPLPELASKPRGGQFWADKEFAGVNVSPEQAARVAARSLAPTEGQQWLERALAKYYKTDFGAPDDPLRDLAARGLHYDVEMTPERWKATVNSYLQEDPIGDVLLPFNRARGLPGAGSGAGDDLRSEAIRGMPWLAKQPVTDNIYGISSGGLDLGHFADEFLVAMTDPNIPADLAVRPEMLQRMSFPQAVERVGRINQWRAKNMADASLAAMDSPAIQTFKEYPDAPYKWVEIRQPEGAIDENDADAFRALEDALRYEGDTMGHCVGGYCDDVLSGRSRIFSLRDAKGQPHVTIETSPGRQRTALADIPRDEIIQIKGKQNRRPNDEYLPFVQDFVRGGTWGDIGDLENTGLRRFHDELVDEKEFNNILKGELDFLSTLPLAKVRAAHYAPSSGIYADEMYDQRADLVDATILPRQDGQPNYYSINEVMSVLEDPGAWDDDIVDSVLGTVRQLRENGLNFAEPLDPRLYEGFAVGGRVKGRDCSCDHFSVRR